VTDTLTAEKIGELEALLAKASPDPWHSMGFLYRLPQTGHGFPIKFGEGDSGPTIAWATCKSENADLIAALRNGARALIAMAKRCMELEGLLKNSRSGEAIMFERAEKAEAEAMKYCEMAVRLARKHVRTLSIREFTQVDDDIAALLAESTL
jgi:hypothetical protein